MTSGSTAADLPDTLFMQCWNHCLNTDSSWFLILPWNDWLLSWSWVHQLVHQLISSSKAIQRTQIQNRHFPCSSFFSALLVFHHTVPLTIFPEVISCYLPVLIFEELSASHRKLFQDLYSSQNSSTLLSWLELNINMKPTHRKVFNSIH
jgi:hypothetical protein